MNVVPMIPRPANANPMSRPPGIARTAHGDATSPNNHIVTRNAVEYMVPRRSAHVVSPTATSVTRRGVASIASKVCAYLYLKKKLNVVSSTAPFIAAAAMRPGATNSLYDTSSPPGPGTLPTSPPTPSPIDSRYSAGSRNPVRNRYHCRRYASPLRSTTRSEPRPIPPGTRRASAYVRGAGGGEVLSVVVI